MLVSNQHVTNELEHVTHIFIVNFVLFKQSQTESKTPPSSKTPPTSSDPRSEIWLDFQKSGPETKIWGHLAQNAMQNPIFSPAALYSACLKAFPPCIEC